MKTSTIYNIAGAGPGVILSLVLTWLLIKMCGHLGSITKTIIG
jgi:hypothetical protein